MSQLRLVEFGVAEKENMYCADCNKDLVDCECPDIEERLAKLIDGFAGPAVRQALLRRAMKRDKSVKPLPSNADEGKEAVEK